MKADKTFHGIPLSILDTSNIAAGSSVRESLLDSLELAQKAEEWGYNRIWFTEHHNMPSVASAATSLVIGYIAGATKRIRVGSGGIMLNNHAPLMVAEQFGTLESMYPGRIDLGLGRAPGGDPAAFAAIRRISSHGDDFSKMLHELRTYFNNDDSAKVQAFPGKGLFIPIWLLGSSDYNARLAAKLGLPFSYAGHFSSDYIVPAVQLYRNLFQPSSVLSKPYVMVSMNVTIADTNEQAQYLASTQKQLFLSSYSGRKYQIMPPVKEMSQVASEKDILFLEQSPLLRTLVIGDRETINSRLQQLIQETSADEIIITTQMYRQEDRLRNYEIIAELLQ
ncbi:hypothetical protein PghCCS26_45790 [Paenibacillus glycanilyticus]|uniref:Luciferase-like domain-containing protein n=1 Tax=Paenibacillus glycanilyticus TaxID=126569 RepID=A0ABQ6NSE9_9BACL|nr:LLM class flavin-dependent oxidoreductase [Paenibacillus glycanilyticus]GMK47449.1 hypothetical protein PghCCS26_45790 [Paenibacillus glycanilyticus]